MRALDPAVDARVAVDDARLARRWRDDLALADGAVLRVGRGRHHVNRQHRRRGDGRVRGALNVLFLRRLGLLLLLIIITASILRVLFVVVIILVLLLALAAVEQPRRDRGRQFQVLGGLATELLGEVGRVPPLQELEGEDAGREQDRQAAEDLGSQGARRQEARARARRRRIRVLPQTPAAAQRRLVLQLLQRLVVGHVHAAHARPDEPQQRVVVLGPVEEVGEVEGDDGEAAGGVDGRVDVAQEPAVAPHEALRERGVGRQAGVVGAEQGAGRLDLVALVEAALEVGERDGHGQVAPDVGGVELEGLAHESGGAVGGARDLAAAANRGLALEAVEVLGEAAAAGAQVVALDEEHEQGVQLIEGVEGAQQVARVPLGRDGQEVAQGRGQEGVELLLRQQLEQRRLLVVKGAPKGRDELHVGMEGCMCEGGLEGRPAG